MWEIKTEITDSGNKPSIQSVENSNNFGEFTIAVNPERYENSFDGVVTLLLGLVGLYYQGYDSRDADDIQVELEMKDAATREVFDTIVYPEALEKIGE